MCARFIVVDAGRRSGKSNWVGHELLPEAARASQDANPGSRTKASGLEFWSVGPTYSDSEKPFRVFYNKCKALGDTLR